MPTIDNRLFIDEQILVNEIRPLDSFPSRIVNTISYLFVPVEVQTRTSGRLLNDTYKLEFSNDGKIWVDSIKKLNGFHAGEIAKTEPKAKRRIWITSDSSVDQPRLFIEQEISLGKQRDLQLNNWTLPSYKAVSISGNAKLQVRPQAIKNRILKAESAPTATIKSVCPITGIISQTDIPSIGKLAFKAPHPFSIFINVQEFVREAGNAGTDLKHCLNKNQVAGMLITTLRHWRFIPQWADLPSLNLVLQEAETSVLIQSLIYYSTKLKSSKGLAGLAIENPARITETLLNHKKLCSGEIDFEIGNRRYQTSNTPIRASIATKTDREKLDSWQIEAKTLIKNLRKNAAKTESHRYRLKYWESSISAIAAIPAIESAKIVEQILTTFRGIADAEQLARIFREQIISPINKLDFEVFSDSIETLTPKRSFAEILAEANRRVNGTKGK